MRNCSQVSAFSQHIMPRDSKWYFVRESDTNEWKVYKSDKPISVGEKTLGALTTVQGSKSNSSILKVSLLVVQ